MVHAEATGALPGSRLPKLQAERREVINVSIRKILMISFPGYKPDSGAGCWFSHAHGLWLQSRCRDGAVLINKRVRDGFGFRIGMPANIPGTEVHLECANSFLRILVQHAVLRDLIISVSLEKRLNNANVSGRVWSTTGKVVDDRQRIGPCANARRREAFPGEQLAGSCCVKARCHCVRAHCQG